MNIKLSVKKETFQLYLEDIGYNYKIKQYDDFIKSLGRYIIREIMHAMTNNNLVFFLNESFDKPLDMGALEDIKKIENLKKEYFKRLIESGIFDLYLNEKEIIVPENIKEEIYLRKRINSLTIEFEYDYFMQSLDRLKNKTLDRKIRNIKKLEYDDITKEKKDELDDKIKNIYINKFESIVLINYRGPETKIDEKIREVSSKEIDLDKPLYYPKKIFYINIINKEEVYKSWKKNSHWEKVENKKDKARGLLKYISNVFGKRESQIIYKDFYKILFDENKEKSNIEGPLIFSDINKDERLIDIEYQLFVQIDLKNKKYKIYLEDSDLY